MDDQPHIETSSGADIPHLRPIAAENQPHIETTGPVPDATGNDTPVTTHDNPLPGTVPVPPEPAKPFDAVEFFKSQSMPMEARTALAKWQRDSDCLEHWMPRLHWMSKFAARKLPLAKSLEDILDAHENGG